MADPHHDAARDHQRGGGEPELLGTEQGADDHVAPRLHLAVHLHHDPVAQIVGQQGLLGLGQSELPGDAGVLWEVSGVAPVPPSCPEMRTTSEWALATPAATVPTPTSATSLTWIRARGLADFRSWMSWAMSSIE